MRSFSFAKLAENKVTLFSLLIISIVSIYPRIWNLPKSPQQIVDESANIRDVDLMFKEGISLTKFHWDFSKSQIVNLPVILLIKMGIEDKQLSLRMASVVLSILSLIPFFLITKFLTNQVIAFCTTLLFSFSYYYLQFSRVGWTDITLGLFLGLTLFWILIKIKSGKNSLKLAALSGLIAGLIFYGYRSGVIVIISALSLLIPKKAAPLNEVRKSLSTTAVFLLAFLITSFPWIRTAYLNQDKYNMRMRVVSIKNVEFPYNGNENFNSTIIYQVKTSLTSWILLRPTNLTGIESQRYLPQDFPVVNLLVILGFWIGLILGLKNLKITYPLFIIFLMGIFGQIITVDPPNGARGLIMLPCIYILFSLSLAKAHKILGEGRFATSLIIFLSAAYSILDFFFYQYWMGWIKV